MKTSPWAMLMVLVTTGLTSAGQVLYKMGTNSITAAHPGVLDFILNPYILSGLAVYGLGAIILITALKYGELSVLYPIIATSYIWVSLLSMEFFGEAMNLHKWLGVVAIIVGVSLIGMGSRSEQRSTATPTPEVR